MCFSDAHQTQTKLFGWTIRHAYGLPYCVVHSGNWACVALTSPPGTKKSLSGWSIQRSIPASRCFGSRCGWFNQRSFSVWVADSALWRILGVSVTLISPP